MKNPKLSLKLLLTAVAFALILLVSTAISIWTYADVDEKRDADVAIVLGAATWNGEVSPVFRERINHGISLYEEGYVGKLILTGGYGEGNDISDASAARDYAIGQGVSEVDILIEEQSTITQENLANAKVIMDENGYATAIIVSDPLHMKRAMLLARDCGIEAYSSPTPTSMYTSLKSRLEFLAREEFFYIGYLFWRII